MTSMRTLIVDDESVARQGLRQMLQDESDIEIVGEAATGREAVEAMERLHPDLVFLDVQMPEMNGFEALAAVDSAEIPAVIFVTAYDQYALRAFDVHALDYLLKPFTNRRLQEALDRTRQHFEQDRVAALTDQIHALLDRLAESDEPAPGDEGEGPLQRIPVKKRHQVLFIDVDEIDWIEAADNYVQIHTGDGAHLVRATLSEMEERLDGNQFLRIHRSTIVNVDRIREMHPRGSGDCDLVLDDGTHLRSSRTYSDRRREVLDFG